MHEDRERGRVRRALVRYMEKKGWPRVMLSLVILVTGLAGFLLSFALLRLGLESMGVRYPLAVLGAYAIFLGLMRLWVEHERHHLDPNDADLQAELANSITEPPPRVIDAQRGSWLDSLDLLNLSDDILSLAFWLFAAVVGLLILLITIIGAAPILIAEVLVDALLVGLLYQRLRIPATEHWLGGAIRKTWTHLLLFILLLTFIGFTLDVMAPGSNTIGQGVKELLHGGGAQ
jgi:hypothetical protein